MRLSERLVSRKAFSQPPFWSNPEVSGMFTGSLPDREAIGNDVAAYINDAYKQSGPVFAASLARQMLFSEARVAFQRPSEDGRPGALFADSGLDLLNNPWPNGTLGELFARMMQDADLAGNFWATTADDDGNLGRAAVGPGRRVARMKPEWTSVILGSKSGNLHALDTKPIAIKYAAPMVNGVSQTDPVYLLPSEVCHFSPNPDPSARFRGMSWLTPVLREIEADKAATKHKLNFFRKGAMLSTIVRLDKEVSPDQFREFVAEFEAKHQGVDTAYKTLFVGGGADVTVNSANMQQLDFKNTQGAGETRIAAASGIHPVIIGLSEGLAGSSLNAGNFDAAKRLTADKTLRPLWRTAAASLQPLVNTPDGATLTYDDRDVAFLRDDSTDVAAIQEKQAITARQLTDAGYTPESVVRFLETNNLSELQHSGLYSVQLQPPGTAQAPIAGEA